MSLTAKQSCKDYNDSIDNNIIKLIKDSNFKIELKEVKFAIERLENGNKSIQVFVENKNREELGLSAVETIGWLEFNMKSFKLYEVSMADPDNPVEISYSNDWRDVIATVSSEKARECISVKKKKSLIKDNVTSLLENENYWQGTIGKSKIYLELNCDISKATEDKDSCRFSRYFYETQLQDIVMEHGGAIAPNRYRLQVVHKDNVVEEFVLNHSNGVLKGTWESKGKSLKVVLKKLKLTQEYDAFETFRAKFLKFKREKVEKLKSSKKELVWIEELHSKTSFFRLGNGFSKASRNRVNPVFDELQNEFSTATLGCASAWNYGTGMETIHASPTYISSNLIGLDIYLNYFCGGAYPDFNTRRHLYDLHSGKRYKLEDILTIAKQPSKIRELAFKAAGRELKAQEPSKDELQNEGYDPYDLQYWEYVGWEYGKKGIDFFLNFSTPERCYRGDSYFIPFKMLKPYKNRLFPYAFGGVEDAK